jgi:hypothetical protein
VAGALAETFQATELSAVVRWTSWGNSSEMALVSFAHWEFLFAIAAVLGLYVMHALSRIDEGREVSERQVVQEFALEAWRSINSLSSVGGALGSLFPFERLSERRASRAATAEPAQAVKSTAVASPGACVLRSACCTRSGVQAGESICTNDAARRRW